jgi:hypothetical protein
MRHFTFFQILKLYMNSVRLSSAVDYSVAWIDLLLFQTVRMGASDIFIKDSLLEHIRRRHRQKIEPT